MRQRQGTVLKKWAHFARNSADKTILLSAMIAAPGFSLLTGGKEIAGQAQHARTRTACSFVRFEG